MHIEVRTANLHDQDQVRQVIELVDSYAREPAGGGRPLPDEVRERLAEEFGTIPNAEVFLGCADGTPAGVAVCFRAYSTFAARPLLNIHDLAVLPERRGQGIGREMLAHIERHARASGCCKLTLEVLERNDGARRLYESVGFRAYGPGEEPVPTLFLEKRL